MRKAVAVSGLTGLIGLVFGVNTLETNVPCYRYACGVNPVQNGNVWIPEPAPTFKWVDGVEVWITSDFPKEAEKYVKRAVKMWNSVAGVNLIYRGRTQEFKSTDFIDYNTCKRIFNSQQLKGKGIFVFVSPNKCKIQKEEQGATLVFPTIFDNKGGALIEIYESALNDFLTYLHEFGHAIGLNHPFELGEPDTGNNPTYSIMQYNHIVPISQDDVEVARYLYGQPSSDSGSIEVFEYLSTENAVISRTMLRCVCSGRSVSFCCSSGKRKL